VLETYVLPLLDDKQAIRVARALVVCNREHPEPIARAAAGHALHRFNHRGAEAFLVDALTDHGVRLAASPDTTGPLEEVVANLYAVLCTLDTPTAHRALAERLFAERRAYARMGRALADVWTPALHADILALLRERRDPRAAGAYAYTLRDFVQQRPPLVDLAELIIDWQGETEVARGFFHYALIVGIDAALATGRLDVARCAHEAAAWIAEPPLEPDHHARGTGWVNPLEDPDVAAALEKALLVKPEEPRITAEAAESARAAERAIKERPERAPKPKPKAKPKTKTKTKAERKPKPEAKPKPRREATRRAKSEPKRTATPKPPRAASKPKAAKKRSR
jgi:hypothetical protein